MADLFSRYISGIQFTAGDIVGDKMGISGINPIVDAVNISTAITANKTSYWGCNGTQFIAGTSSDDFHYGASAGEFTADQEAVFAHASVQLPDGAVVTAVIVYGDGPAEAETWNLYRLTLTDKTQAIMAGPTAVNTEDTSISNATIDNSTYSYMLRTTTIDTNDEIYGARITYTTDYI